MVSVVLPIVPHVPAWKRLGLKLKYANETPGGVTPTQDPVLIPRKRDYSEAGLKSEGAPPKKSKKPVLSSSEKASEKDTASFVPSASQSEQPTPRSPTATPSPTKRKSVAFTPETKSQDGDSLKQLYDTWLAEQKAEDTDFEADHTGQALKLAFPAPNEPTLKAKKSKKEKTKEKHDSASAQPSASSSSCTNSSLEYLTLYHSSRANWKFNKAKQTYLLKNLLDVSRIPPSYDEGLASYLAGLQGASARGRIRDAALATVKADNEALSEEAEKNKEGERMEDPARRREYYAHALKLYKDQLKGLEIEREDRERELDPAWRLRLLKRKRAEMVLWATGRDTDAGIAEDHAMNGNGVTAHRAVDENAQKRTRLNDGNVKRRRRKRRTGVPDDDDDDSSSSSSSSSSETSSSEEDSGDDGAKDQDGEAGSSSSSSTSSSASSSGSDDDDESSSESDSG
ncbi:hypothetical protein MMC08_000148 [Hypocenomyce scalaris]|nr:hypothetical protein [Hypocenomyce scalaris]